MPLRTTTGEDAAVAAGDRWNPALYDQKHAFVFEYGRDLVALLNPQPAERILDLGCGTGRLTKVIGASGAQVVGIDDSPSMIAMARAEYPISNSPRRTREVSFSPTHSMRSFPTPPCIGFSTPKASSVAFPVR